MKSTIGLIAGMTALAAFAGPAAAGPGFAYSWLSTNKTFDQCIAAADTMMRSLNFPQIQRTKFGVTGETTDDTVFVNCEDQNHVSVVLMRAKRPQVGEIDALVALMQQILETSAH